MITVFYDGKCGLCHREIEYYKRIALEGIFNWVDITVDASGIDVLGIPYPDALKLLHVQDENGNLNSGVEAFLTIWRQIRGWKYLAKFIGLPLMRPIAKGLYGAFAAWRFSRLAHCQIALKDYNIKKK
jgi:predicted DCC family thiol-disulfide oxidoreductase YuxK